ncbi:MAG: hypothetical protein SNJ57_18150 [Cyanobacteriota bacterium]
MKFISLPNRFDELRRASLLDPCPICGSRRGGCRFDRVQVFCSAGDRPAPENWRSLGQTREGFWEFQNEGAIALYPKTEGKKSAKPDGARAIAITKTFPQIAQEQLYQDTAWICVLGKLYRWQGTHYIASPDEVERRRIAELADRWEVQTKDGPRTKYATPSQVNNALEWIKQRVAIPPEWVNPAGVINCTNGVLVFDWEADRLTTRLEPHDPSRHYFLSEPGTAYDPNAPTEDCDRLLSALDPAEQKILLRTMAAAIDIDRVRKRHGRLIRGILARGVGNNGKDSHREAFSQIFGGAGFVSVALEDFAQYDDGRKFPLAGLRNARVSWAPENNPSVNLDGSKSLKGAITGDPLHFELKGRDHEEFSPRSIFVFNINDVPNLKARLEAIRSRFAVLTYNKVYRIGANPERGEIEADPRFKYDPGFLRSNVLPALLNKLVEAFQALMVEGIDYSPCDRALEQIQLHNSHLFEFALESGLKADRDSIIPIGEFWARLEHWYRSTDVLSWQGDRNAWAEPIRRGDDWVKGANQIYNRFSVLFPSIELVNLGGNRRGIKGLKFESSPRQTPTAAPATNPEPEQQTPAAQPLQVGDRVVVIASGKDGTIAQVEGDRALVDGRSVYGWVSLSELKRPSPALATNGRAGP